MDVSSKRVMYYHADAAPVGGHLLSPAELILPTEASLCLGQAGGHATARVEKHEPHPSILMGALSSEVKGSIDRSSGNWTTLVTSTVENINLFGLVTADKIVSQLTVEHPRLGYYPRISFAGCRFENLRIGGKAATVQMRLTLLEAEPPVEHTAGIGPQTSQENLRSSQFPDCPWPEVPAFVERAVAQNLRMTMDQSAPQWVKDRYAWMGSKDERTKKGYIVCSLVEEIRGPAPGSTFGHTVHVPGLGTIYLGELMVDQRSFHLTMLRVELGEGDSDPTAALPSKEQSGSGHLSFASAISNGSPMP